MTKKNILVFQHVSVEHPGIFRDFVKRDGWELHTVELDAGEPIPELEQFDALWVMGGPMDVWQEDEYPWLRDEKQAIYRAVEELQKPYLGICLGHQLLAAAYGAEVGLGSTEVGVMDVNKSEAGRQSPFLAGLDDVMTTLQWHSAEVKNAPDGFDVLASSEACQIQSLSRGQQVLSMQFHQEILGSTVADWSAIPAYRQSLEASLGPDGVNKLDKNVRDILQTLNVTAERVYRNWCSMVFAE